MVGYIGEIRLWGPTWAPRSWALCNGQIMQINQNNALFSIIGTIYGGDGRVTFALPDIRGRVAIHPGAGPGLPSYRLGQKLGQEYVTLSANQIPNHVHTANATDSVSLELLVNSGDGDSDDPSGKYLAQDANQGTALYNATANTTMSPSSIVGSVSTSAILSNNGGNNGHLNLQPFEVVNYIICLQGIYPSRN